MERETEKQKDKDREKETVRDRKWQRGKDHVSEKLKISWFTGHGIGQLLRLWVLLL